MKLLRNKLVLRHWICWGVLFLVIIIGSYYVSNNWYQFMLIQGESMSPTYHDKQLVVLNKYDDEFTYGDVIAFWCEDLSCALVKRIVACPGDTVVIENGTLFINEEISIVYPAEDKIMFEGMLKERVHLGKGQYIVLGDNITESKDSRYPEVGCVSEEDIIGEIAYPNKSK